MMNTSEIYSKRSTFMKMNDGFIPLKAVAEILESIKKRAFKSGIPGANETKNNQFEKIFSEEKEGISFNPLNEKRINSEDLYPGIFIQKEDKIKSNGLKATHRYPYATNLYGRNGEYVGGIKKGDEVVLDVSGGEIKSYSTMDKKTGRYMAYVRIIGTLEGGNIINSSIGYIRAPWLDHRVNIVKKETEIVNNIPRNTQISFDNFYAPDGKIIPGYILKAVSINYFGKNIYPQVQEKLIEGLNDKRAEMTKEILLKKVPLQECTLFPSYQIQRSRVSLYGKIGEAYKNGEDISKDATVASFLYQLQKKPEWQKVLQQASIVYQKQRKSL